MQHRPSPPFHTHMAHPQLAHPPQHHHHLQNNQQHHDDFSRQQHAAVFQSMEMMRAMNMSNRAAFAHMFSAPTPAAISTMHGHPQMIPMQRPQQNKTDGRKTAFTSNNRSFSSIVKNIAPDPYGTRYTGGEERKITAAQITQSIPADASSIFHILDRRINFDAFPEDASFYSLLRAWVQDDPYRYIPPTDTLMVKVKSGGGENVETSSITYPAKKIEKAGADLPKCDVVHLTKTRYISVQTLNDETIRRCKKHRTKKRKQQSKKLACAAAKLRERGFKGF